MAVRGLFITFEGGEGSGKTTQTERLKRSLEGRGRRVMQMREPGGTKLGEDLRTLLLNSTSIAPTTELLLFVAARAELVHKAIRPALEAGIDVICDRFIDSTMAYQGYGRGIDMNLIRTLNEAAIAGCTPDLTVLLDIDPKAGLARVSEGTVGDAIEGHWQAGLELYTEDKRASGQRVGGRDLTFHRKVRSGYRKMAQAEPKRWLRIDARISPDEVETRIWKRVDALLSRGQPKTRARSSKPNQSLNLELAVEPERATASKVVAMSARARR
jgi:dTMP kinase